MGDAKKLPPLNACYNTTDFENMSYEDMRSMVRGVNATEIMGKGTALVDAQTEIEKIGTELKEHIGRTTWQGKGGDAFREWGNDFAKETLKLADYAGAAGTSMQTAGQALSEVVTAMGGHPDATQMCFADEKKEKARIAAVETARNEAIPQMNKLASYYLMAQQSISLQEEPNFRPLPNEVLPTPTGHEGGQESYGPPGGHSGGGTYSATTSQAGGASKAHHYTASRPGDFTASSPDGAPVHTPQHVTVVPGAPDTTGTNIDTVTMPPALPPATLPPSGGFPPPGPVGGGHLTPPPPVVMPPYTGGPSSPGGGGRRTPPTGPGGRNGVGGVRPPTITRTDTGIVGGTRAPGQTGADSVRSTSRGTVIGSEKQSTSHGMMAGGGGGGHGVTGGRSGPGGGSQRLVSEPGGTVRAPRGAQPGAGREFTPGGTGLVRESPTAGSAKGPMGGSMGSAPQGARRRSQRRDGANPGYLTEDEETWAPGDHGVVPPVIG
ncbi:hypothetical protein QMK19_21590 [Streptomyces sp. H10-C2]|uniref:WXG100 family type VII secretion target n=1 Tax=unclassified Streptomyces TaxID=2593676 RepID=UPI0024B9659F|nr:MULTISPECIES: hypothetical protein [unclassified Streptomyces]MDJ0342330.1 hypothetical protein [Streptomyces sp. PH10-H1]MDJ0372185.1 hypothetical protein [Streptomyces sp. H10-C2]